MRPEKNYWKTIAAIERNWKEFNRIVDPIALQVEDAVIKLLAFGVLGYFNLIAIIAYSYALTEKEEEFGWFMSCCILPVLLVDFLAYMKLEDILTQRVLERERKRTSIDSSPSVENTSK